MNKFYVYTLAYPDGTVFYVGKGSKSRIMNHEADARNPDRAHTYYSRKSEIIRKIWEEGGQVLKQKVAFFDNEDEAFAFEQELINSLDKECLLNAIEVRIGGRCQKREKSELPLVEQLQCFTGNAHRRVIVDQEQACKLAILAEQGDVSIHHFIGSLIDQTWEKAIGQ